MGDPLKKMHLLTLLRLYSKDRDINSLGASLNILLDSPTEKRLCQDIRCEILNQIPLTSSYICTLYRVKW